MSKGLAQALLISSIEAFKGAAPVTKVTTPGFLQYLLDNNKPDIISMSKDDGTGYLRDVKIRYRTRGVPGRSVTVDDCSVQVRPSHLEYTVPQTSYRALGVTFEDDLIARFEVDALKQVALGNASTMTPVMKDIYEGIIEQANTLFADINNDLLAVQSASFGKNVVNGLNTAKTINFALNGTNNALNSGMTEVMSDAMANEIRLPGASIVGSGLVNNYYLQQIAKSADQAGLNTSQLALPKFYFDQYAQAAWSPNNFGLFERDAVQFVNTCRFRGAKSGMKGADYFTTMRLPITDSLGQGNLGAFEFDVQLAYRTCPSEVAIAGAAPVLMGRGWNIILSASYQSVNIPSNSYAVGDRLNLVNGTFRYVATNA